MNPDWVPSVPTPDARIPLLTAPICQSYPTAAATLPPPLSAQLRWDSQGCAGYGRIERLIEGLPLGCVTLFVSGTALKFKDELT